MFDIRPNDVLDVIETQMMEQGSHLSSALEQLSALASGRGACLCLEHRDTGIIVIADNAWNMDQADTVLARHKHSVFSLRGHEGFDTISVLVGAAHEGELDHMRDNCAIAAAAVDVMASVSIARAMLA